MEKIVTTNPGEFFRQQVTDAAFKLGKQLDVQVEFYLVNLLCQFVSGGPGVRPSDDLDLFRTPLALMLKKALEAPVDQQVKIYKCLGDSSLFLAGYFGEYLAKKLINRSYCITMGASAYDSVASIMKVLHRDEDFSAIYRELSSQFPELVAIYATIATEEKNHEHGMILPFSA